MTEDIKSTDQSKEAAFEASASGEIKTPVDMSEARIISEVSDPEEFSDDEKVTKVDVVSKNCKRSIQSKIRN